MKIKVSIFVLFLLVGSTTACKKEDKETNRILEIINDDINNKINTQFLIAVSTINLKIIKVIQLAKENDLDYSTQKMIHTIEKKHLDLNSKIKQIASKNLIIIPDTIYDYSTDLDTLNNNRNYVYLVEIEKLMQQEKEEYKLIKENTQNTEIKNLAHEAIYEIDNKLVEIDSVLNKY